MFRVSQHPSSGALKTVTATSGIGHAVKYKLKLARVTWHCVCLLTVASNVWLYVYKFADVYISKVVIIYNVVIIYKLTTFV